MLKNDYVCFVQRNDRKLFRYPVLESPRTSAEEIRDQVEGEEKNRKAIEIYPSIDFDDVSFGNDQAILVFLPNWLSRSQIFTIPPSSMDSYPWKRVNYNSDSSSFDGIDGIDGMEGYRKFLIEEGGSNRDQAGLDSIWKLGSKWIVNFEPQAYEAFVSRKLDSLRLPLGYYRRIFGNRGIDLLSKFPTLDKVEMAKFIADEEI